MAVKAKRGNAKGSRVPRQQVAARAAKKWAPKKVQKRVRARARKAVGRDFFEWVAARATPLGRAAEMVRQLRDGS